MLTIISLLLTSPLAATPNWPSSVHVNPTQGTIDSIYSQQHHNQFGSSRYAFLFTPGYHSVKAEVGYYTSVYGLGALPTDTNIQEVRCDASGGGETALSTFWRSAENFKTGTMTWAVSQAAPLRRIEVDGSLHLSQSGYSSGGYMGDVLVNGGVYPGSQQQWATRNSKFTSWNGGAWNFVWVGCEGAPGNKCGGSVPMHTNVESTPIIAEKPFISVDGDDWYLNLPQVEENVKGVSWERGTQIVKVSFDRVYIADADNINGLQAAMGNTNYDAVVLSPGVYYLTKTLEINRAFTLLGLGMATLVAPGLNSAVVVGDNVRDVRVAGILFQASTQNTGNRDDTKPTQPLLAVGGYQTVLSDVFARVGGPNDPHTNQARADIMVYVNGQNVILDNSWFWRADHDITGEVYDENNPSDHGIVVDGPNFHAYGLVTEHTLKDLTVFNAENAVVYFYQSEMPYSVSSGWNYSAYKVASGVQRHTASGLGAYSFFRDHYNDPADGFDVPKNCGIDMKNMMTVHLGGGNGKGGIRNVVGNEGGMSDASHMYSLVCDWLGNGQCAPSAPPSPVPGPTPLPPSPIPSPVPSPTHAPGTKTYCVPKPGADIGTLWTNIEWACQHGGISCSGEPSGCHGDRNASGQYAHQKDGTYVFSKYYAMMRNSGGTCNFSGLAELTTNPTYPGCVYNAVSRLNAIESAQNEEAPQKVIRWLDNTEA